MDFGAYGFEGGVFFGGFAAIHVVHVTEDYEDEYRKKFEHISYFTN